LARRDGSLSTEAHPIPGFVPETELERALAGDPELQAGWSWGRPRSGHPEGTVGAHVGDLLRTIDEWGEQGTRRRELRILALLHDSLKSRVNHALPRTGENHHAMRARRFAEGYVDDERLLAVLELHDRPYGIWRKLRRTGTLDERRWDEMLARIPDLGLFLRFVELDASTEGKDPEPLDWFREELSRRDVA
jgi:hypothetical protein